MKISRVYFNVSEIMAASIVWLQSHFLLSIWNNLHHVSFMTTGILISIYLNPSVTWIDPQQGQVPTFLTTVYFWNTAVIYSSALICPCHFYLYVIRWTWVSLLPKNVPLLHVSNEVLKWQWHKILVSIHRDFYLFLWGLVEFICGYENNQDRQ